MVWFCADMACVSGDLAPVENWALARLAASLAGEISLNEGKGMPGSEMPTRMKDSGSFSFMGAAAALFVVADNGGWGGVYGKPALRAVLRAACSAARRSLREIICVLLR